jgi:hypothetical protein
MNIQNFSRSLTAVVILFCASGPAVAQISGTAAGVPVRMIVSVEAKKGKEIPTITQRDVIVHQGKDVRPVTAWVPATGNNAGLALAVLIDDSAGFSLGTQLNDIRNFIQEQAPTTLVALGYMQNGTVFLAHDFTQDHAAVAKTVRLAQGYSGAEPSPYVSLSDFVKRWRGSPSQPRREVLMITSGIDLLYLGTYPDPYVDASVEDSQCAGVVVYSLYTPSAGHLGHSYWRSNWGQNFLAQLSEETGGESYYLLGPEAPVAFAPYLDKLNQQLQHQFLLTFLAEPHKKAGREQVHLTCEYHQVDLVYADNVCVPASPE